jgi:hypothetical protein
VTGVRGTPHRLTGTSPAPVHVTWIGLTSDDVVYADDKSRTFGADLFERTLAGSGTARVGKPVRVGPVPTPGLAASLVQMSGSTIAFVKAVGDRGFSAIHVVRGSRQFVLPNSALVSVSGRNVLYGTAVSWSVCDVITGKTRPLRFIGRRLAHVTLSGDDVIWENSHQRTVHSRPLQGGKTTVVYTDPTTAPVGQDYVFATKQFIGGYVYVEGPSSPFVWFRRADGTGSIHTFPLPYEQRVIAATDQGILTSQIIQPNDGPETVTTSLWSWTTGTAATVLTQHYTGEQATAASYLQSVVSIEGRRIAWIDPQGRAHLGLWK